jgi:hypothetical protein
VVAEDSVLLREGIARGCSRTPASRSSAKPVTPTTCCSRSEIRDRHPGVGVLALSEYVESG